jgi:hypothetical protein
LPKKKDRDSPFRTIVDYSGRADWLRAKKYGQLGYVEPQEDKELDEAKKETFVPRKQAATVAWREKDHGPLPTGGKKKGKLSRSERWLGKRRVLQRSAHRAPQRLAKSQGLQWLRYDGERRHR